MIVNSHVFGTVEYPSAELCLAAETLVDLHPIAFFQALNKKMNSRGWVLSVGVLDGDSEFDPTLYTVAL